MIPHELSPRKITLAQTDHHSIVLITRQGLQHDRFAYRIQQEFGDLVLAWYQFRPKSAFVDAGSLKEKWLLFSRKMKKRLSPEVEAARRCLGSSGLTLNGNIRRKFLLGLHLACAIATDAYLLRRRRKQQAVAERRLFGREVEDLKQYSKVSPISIENPNSKEFIEDIKRLNPYFFLSLGGPLYKKELLEQIRGAAINQHAGWAPALKGGHTVEWALYYRNLNYVGNTVHLTTTAADAGAILRRGQTCLINDDTPESCFARTVALGVELVIEVIQEVISNKEIFVYDQPIVEGMTYTGLQLNRDILKAIYRDFSNDWLKKELLRIKNF